jgi:hypothetical protein
VPVSVYRRIGRNWGRVHIVLAQEDEKSEVAGVQEETRIDPQRKAAVDPPHWH